MRAVLNFLMYSAISFGFIFWSFSAYVFWMALAWQLLLCSS